MYPLIETGEKRIRIHHIQSHPLILDRDPNPVFFRRQSGNQCSGRTRLTKLQRIHQEVGQNKFTLVLIERNVFYLFVQLVLQFNAFHVIFTDEFISDRTYPLIQRMWQNMQHIFSFLQLSHIQHHINDTLHLIGLLINRNQQLFHIFLVRLLIYDTLQWRTNQRKRSTKLMTDIRQEINLLLIHLIFQTHNFPFLFGLLFTVEVVDNAICHQPQQYI